MTGMAAAAVGKVENDVQYSYDTVASTANAGSHICVNVCSFLLQTSALWSFIPFVGYITPKH